MPSLASLFKSALAPEENEVKGIKAVLLGPPGSGKGTQVGGQGCQVNMCKS